MSANFVLEMRDISKEFPGVRALDKVTLKVRKGTVHGLMGENGAGKSTLMKILTGMYSPTDGSIMFDGQPLKMSSIKDAISSGIAMIHQELSPVLYTTVAENIFMNRIPTYTNGFVVNHKQLYKQTAELLTSLEINIDPTTLMKDLSIANMQLVEIAKAISYNSKLIVMDEPTSAITDKEVDHLFNMIAKLKAKDVTIIYITHKMDEVFKICDDLTVLRDGQYVGTEACSDITKEKLIAMMVGRELTSLFPKEEAEIKEIVFEVKNLTSKSKRFSNISFEVRAGEILGFAGLMGAGRSEVLECVFGITKPDEGEIFIKGKKIIAKSPKDMIENGVGLVTEDRKQTGCFLPLTVEDNMMMSCIDKYASSSVLKKDKIAESCEAQKKALSIKTPSMQQLIQNLSGGNQQKVIISRWLLNDPDVLIVDEPTRGIDVNAKAEVHRLLSTMAKQGKAIIMVSSEMPEIIGMSDRIIIMHEGKITGELNRSEATQERIMQLAIK